MPLNIFQYGGITPAMFNYLSTPGLKTGSSIESTVDGKPLPTADHSNTPLHSNERLAS